MIARKHDKMGASSSRAGASADAARLMQRRWRGRSAAGWAGRLWAWRKPDLMVISEQLVQEVKGL